MPRKKDVGDGGSAAQKRTHWALPDTVRATKEEFHTGRIWLRACYAQCVYSFVKLYDRDVDLCPVTNQGCGFVACYLCCRGSQKYNHEWGLQQLREVWTKTFKSSAAQKMRFKKMTLK
jgi:hypothetical protein